MITTALAEICVGGIAGLPGLCSEAPSPVIPERGLVVGGLVLEM